MWPTQSTAKPKDRSVELHQWPDFIFIDSRGDSEHSVHCLKLPWLVESVLTWAGSKSCHYSRFIRFVHMTNVIAVLHTAAPRKLTMFCGVCSNTAAATNCNKALFVTLNMSDLANCCSCRYLPLQECAALRQTMPYYWHPTFFPTFGRKCNAYIKRATLPHSIRVESGKPTSSSECVLLPSNST